MAVILSALGIRKGVMIGGSLTPASAFQIDHWTVEGLRGGDGGWV